jgi:hypothetical protein
MKQTAVEWLVEKMTQQDFIAIPTPEWIEQAKAMEKEQIKNAWINSLTTADYHSSEQYYNKTYEKNI